jgi:hypothetical protein
MEVFLFSNFDFLFSSLAIEVKIEIGKSKIEICSSH